MAQPWRRCAALLALTIPAAEAFVNHVSSLILHEKAALPSARGRYLRQRVVCAAEVEWSAAKVVSNEKAAEGTRVLKIEAGNTASGYTTPGQFVQIKKGDGSPSFFAIASPPQASQAAGVLEFLVKEAESNAWLCESGSGSSVDLSGVMGKGFNIAEEFKGYKYDFPVQNILLVATGTGVAPIRAAIESGMLEVGSTDPFGRSCRLYLGVRSPEALPYREEIAGWEARGIEVVPVFSRSTGGNGMARTGYVQEALAADGVRVPRNTGVLMVGQKDMCNAVKEQCAKAKVFPGRVLLNF